MDQAALVDELEPGALKDELLKDFDPSQETYEEYLQRKSLERPFNMAEGGSAGQLVTPSVDGSRPGYSGDKTILQVLRENIEEKGGAKVFKFEKGVTKDGYKKNGLIDKIIKNTNTELSPKKISKLIDQISTEKGWLTKQKYRKWAIVDSFMKDYGINDEFTGAGKFDERLKEFKLKHKGSEFKEINETFNNWRKGDFEVAGYDRSKFDKHLKKNLKNWKPIIRTEKMIESTQELKWLNDINKKYPNWSRDRVEKAFNNKFKKNKFWSDTNFTNRSIDLYGHLVHGKGKNNTVISGVDIGNRSKWVKEVMGEVKGGNYYRFLIAADKYEANGNIQSAKKLRNAAKDLFLKDEGVFYGLGQAEHPWFSNYGGTKGMLQIDSLVKGDLNAFKANNFEIPIRDLIKKYEAKGVSDLQKKRILDEINLRRNFLNSITDIGDGGMARNVTFDSTSTPGKIKIINKTPDIYQLHKTGKVDPLELQTRGTAYRDAVIKNLTRADYNILKKDQSLKIGKIGSERINKFLKQAGFNIDKCLSSGGRVKLQGGGGANPVNTCIRGVIEEEQKKGLKGNKVSLEKFGKFGKLARTAGWFLGPIDIPIELGFALPHMLAGDKEAAKRATTFGLFGYGKDKMDEIKAGSPEGYKYAKHMKDNEDYINAWFENQDLTEDLANLKKDIVGKGTDIQNYWIQEKENQIKAAEDKMNSIVEGYKGYYDEEGKFDVWGEAKGKSALQDYLIKDVTEKTDKGLDMKEYGGHGMNIALGLPWNFGMKEGIAPFKGGQPITNLKQYIAQRGQPYWKQLEHAAYELGRPELFNRYFTTADVREPEDAYSDLPIKYASELGKLEKEEMLRGLKAKGLHGTVGFKKMLEAQGIDPQEVRDVGKKDWEFDILGKRRLRAYGGRAGYMGGGITGIRKPSAIPPKSGPMSQGLRSLYNNGRKL